MEYIISGIVGLTTGAFASLLAPWVNWKLEQKKENRKDKIKLITDLRFHLEKNEPKEEEFLNSNNYIRIRPFLSDKLIKELEDFETLVLHSAFRSIYKANFLEELEHIEESWKISLIKNIKKNKSYIVNNSRPRITIKQSHNSRITKK
ncbi:hypothetical protein MCEGE10_01931 [Flavobacteriaceae bacterium]